MEKGSPHSLPLMESGKVSLQLLLDAAPNGATAVVLFSCERIRDDG